MDDIRERNRKIFQMALDGVSQRDIAHAFRLSTTRIWLVVREIKRENAIAERRGNIAEAMRQADDLDRPWVAADMVDVLQALTSTRNALLKHFASLKKEQISLREMMNLAIPESVDSDGWHSPLYRITYIGLKGYQSIINGLSEITLNSRCSQEWERKLAWLKRSLIDGDI